jgi:hypothetical protein
MKRLALSIGLPLLAAVLGVGTPAVASAHGWRGGGAVVGRGGGYGGYGGGYRGYGGGGHGGYAYPRYGSIHPYYGAYPAYGHWGSVGPTHVWFGIGRGAPYAGSVWTTGGWVWNGYQWVWQPGYWAPPY